MWPMPIAQNFAVIGSNRCREDIAYVGGRSLQVTPHRGMPALNGFVMLLYLSHVAARRRLIRGSCGPRS